MPRTRRGRRKAVWRERDLYRGIAMSRKSNLPESHLDEQTRPYGWKNVVATLVNDLRFAARQLRSNAGFAAVSVLTLALGIGATASIFSVINPILFKPLPYPNAGRVMMIWDKRTDGLRLEVAFGTYREL